MTNTERLDEIRKRAKLGKKVARARADAFRWLASVRRLGSRLTISECNILAREADALASEFAWLLARYELAANVVEAARDLSDTDSFARAAECWRRFDSALAAFDADQGGTE